MNRICLTGNIVKDIELRYTKNNKGYVENTIAVRKDKKDEEGKYKSDFIDFVTFEKKAEYLNQYAKKGDKVEIEGKLRVDSWKDDKDQFHTRSYVVCDKINILTSRIKTPKEDIPGFEGTLEQLDKLSIKTEQQQQFDIDDSMLPF